MAKEVLLYKYLHLLYFHFLLFFVNKLSFCLHIIILPVISWPWERKESQCHHTRQSAQTCLAALGVHEPISSAVEQDSLSWTPFEIRDSLSSVVVNGSLGSRATCPAGEERAGTRRRVSDANPAPLSQRCTHTGTARRIKCVWVRGACVASWCRSEAGAVTTKSHFPMYHVLGALEGEEDGHKQFLLPSYPAGFCFKKLVVFVFSAFDVVHGSLFCLKISKPNIYSFRKDWFALIKEILGKKGKRKDKKE